MTNSHNNQLFVTYSFLYFRQSKLFFSRENDVERVGTQKCAEEALSLQEKSTDKKEKGTEP